MRLERLLLITLAALGLGLTSCGGEEAVRTVELGAADSGKTVEVAPGDEILVTLDSNVTTGFQWNLTSELDADVLELVSSEYVPPEGGLVGEGGVEVWRFEAVSPGTTGLELSYFRPFDPGDVQGSFALTVTVGE